MESSEVSLLMILCPNLRVRKKEATEFHRAWEVFSRCVFRCRCDPILLSAVVLFATTRVPGTNIPEGIGSRREQRDRRTGGSDDYAVIAPCWVPVWMAIITVNLRNFAGVVSSL